MTLFIGLKADSMLAVSRLKITYESLRSPKKLLQSGEAQKTRMG